MEGVAQLHSAAVAAAAAHDGFTVTGSADRLLRVWGSDLRGAYMEVQHESAVTGGAALPPLLRMPVLLLCQQAG